MARDFFDELGENISRRAQDLSEKVGSAYESQKMRGKISNEERAIDKLMTDIGKLIYAKFTDGGEVESDLVSLCEEILSHEQAINELKESAAAKKGMKICPACKKEVAKDAAFCPYCGTQVPDPEPEEKPAEEEVTDFTETPAEDFEEVPAEEDGVEVVPEEEEAPAEEETASEEEAVPEEAVSEEEVPEETADEEEAPEEDKAQEEE